MLNTPPRLVRARIPTDVGEFQLYLYDDNPDGKEHLAIVVGEVNGRENVLVRVHSECFTGDVLGSRRCDCGEQLNLALKRIAEEGQGVILYLRQEGRGIGLRDKLRAYNLQDEGYDTVDANLMLGHADDEREYSAAAEMLGLLNIHSIQLLTNNPDKIESLKALGVTVNGRISHEPTQITADNADYLQTKVQRMRHLLNLRELPYINGLSRQHEPSPLDLLKQLQKGEQRPIVTLSYAQTLDGSIAAKQGEPFAISGSESMTLTHQIRAAHDGILVGIGTALADNPSLTVRLVEGENPRPIVLDSQLRLPLSAKLLSTPPQTIIATTEAAPAAKQQALEATGAQVIRLPADDNGRVSLPHLLTALSQLGINTLMVEGGAGIITSFLAQKLADGLIVTISPRFLGGHRVVSHLLSSPFALHNVQQKQLGPDLVVWGQRPS